MYKIEDILNTIICGDCLEELKKIPDESIDMVITSPPYYALRNYHVEGQIGLEKTFEEYLEKILEITAEIKRVLKKTGQFWLNLGDIYGSHTFGNSQLAGGIQKKLCQEEEGFPRYSNKAKSLGDKCLGMMPERIAIAMIDKQNWILRNKIKWAKQILNYKEKRTQGSVMPTSTKDRFNESGEELYFFVKNKKYYSNLDAVRLPPQSELNFERPRMGQGNQTIYEQKRAPGIIRQQYYPESKYNKFNYRVRDAKRKDGQPQFKAKEEEIKKYQEKYDKRNWKQEESEGYKIGSVDSHRATLRGGLKRLNKPNKVGDPRGNHEGGPGSWRDFKDTHPYRNKTFIDQNVKGLRQAPEPGEPNAFHPLGKNLPTIWLIQTEPHNFKKELGINIEHFAIFPEKLCEIPIKFGCPKNGIVLDPFMGSGTTAIVAKKLGRNYIGIELNHNYIKIAEERLKTINNTLPKL